MEICIPFPSPVVQYIIDAMRLYHEQNKFPDVNEIGQKINLVDCLECALFIGFDDYLKYLSPTIAQNLTLIPDETIQKFPTFLKTLVVDNIPILLFDPDFVISHFGFEQLERRIQHSYSPKMNNYPFRFITQYYEIGVRNDGKEDSDDEFSNIEQNKEIQNIFLGNNENENADDIENTTNSNQYDEKIRKIPLTEYKKHQVANTLLTYGIRHFSTSSFIQSNCTSIEIKTIECFDYLRPLISSFEILKEIIIIGCMQIPTTSKMSDFLLPSLVRLEISKTKIDISHLREIIEFASESENLTSICLRETKMGSVGCEMIADAVKNGKFDRLKNIDIGSNGTGGTSMTRLLQVITESRVSLARRQEERERKRRLEMEAMRLRCGKRTGTGSQRNREARASRSKKGGDVAASASAAGENGNEAANQVMAAQDLQNQADDVQSQRIQVQDVQNLQSQVNQTVQVDGMAMDDQQQKQMQVAATDQGMLQQQQQRFLPNQMQHQIQQFLSQRLMQALAQNMNVQQHQIMPNQPPIGQTQQITQHQLANQQNTMQPPPQNTTANQPHAASIGLLSQQQQNQMLRLLASLNQMTPNLLIRQQQNQSQQQQPSLPQRQNFQIHQNPAAFQPPQQLSHIDQSQIHQSTLLPHPSQNFQIHQNPQEQIQIQQPPSLPQQQNFQIHQNTAAFQPPQQLPHIDQSQILPSTSQPQFTSPHHLSQNFQIQQQPQEQIQIQHPPPLPHPSQNLQIQQNPASLDSQEPHDDQSQNLPPTSQPQSTSLHPEDNEDDDQQSPQQSPHQPPDDPTSLHLEGLAIDANFFSPSPDSISKLVEVPLRAVSLRGIHWDGESATLVREALKVNKEVKFWDLSAQVIHQHSDPDLSPEIAQDILKQSSAHIDALFFSNHKLQHINLSCIVHLTNLRALALTSSNLMDDSVETIEPLLKNLSFLDLSYNSINFHSNNGSFLVSCVKSPTLKYLMLSNNDIGDNGGKLIFDTMKEIDGKTKISTLRLRNCFLRHKSSAALMDLLATGKMNFMELDVGGNDMFHKVHVFQEENQNGDDDNDNIISDNRNDNVDDDDVFNINFGTNFIDKSQINDNEEENAHININSNIKKSTIETFFIGANNVNRAAFCQVFDVIKGLKFLDLDNIAISSILSASNKIHGLIGLSICFARIQSAKDLLKILQDTEAQDLWVVNSISSRVLEGVLQNYLTVPKLMSIHIGSDLAEKKPKNPPIPVFIEGSL